MCLFQHVGKQDRTHTRTHMVKIALRKLFAGILCGCVVLLVLVAKWVMKKKSKPIHILTALFTTGIHKEYKQVLPCRPTSWKPWPTSSTVRVSVTTFENRTGSMQEQIWSKLHCASCLLVFCVVEWCCWCCSLVVKWMQERNHPIISKPYSNCTVSQPGFTKKERLVSVS